MIHYNPLTYLFKLLVVPTNLICNIYSVTQILTIISIQIENVEDAANLPGSCNIRRRPILSQSRPPTGAQTLPAPPPPPRIRRPVTNTVTSAMLRNNDPPLAASTPIHDLDELILRGPDGQPIVGGGRNGLNIISSRGAQPGRTRPRPRSPSPAPRNGNLNITYIFISIINPIQFI